MERLLINSSEAAQVKNFGVEFEVINCDESKLIAALQIHGIRCESQGYNHRTASCWKIVTDSSIRCPNSKGREVVSPVLNGVAGLKQVRTVCEALYFIGASVNKSCGFHVHHEANDLSNQQKNNLLAFYARIENTVDSFMPTSRKGDVNAYCRSMVSFWRNAQGHQSIPQFGRYYKLNFEALQRHGTLEFRQHAGTIDFDKIYYWVCFTANFLHFCKDKRSQAAMNYIERAWVPKHLNLSKRAWAYFKARAAVLEAANDRRTGSVRAA